MSPSPGSVWSGAKKGLQSGVAIKQEDVCECLAPPRLLTQAVLPAALTRDQVPLPAPQGLTPRDKAWPPPASRAHPAGKPCLWVVRRMRQEG